jgi:hypothetical protein
MQLKYNLIMETKQELYEKVMHYAHLLEDKLSYDETKEGKRWCKLVNKLQAFEFEEKIEKLLAQKLKEDKELEKEFQGILLGYTIENYTQRKDKIETEIDLLKRLLKE